MEERSKDGDESGAITAETEEVEEKKREREPLTKARADRRLETGDWRLETGDTIWSIEEEEEE